MGSKIVINATEGNEVTSGSSAIAIAFVMINVTVGTMAIIAIA